MEVAEFLEKNDKVRKVYYTGLKSNPQREIIEKQQRGHTSLMSFVLDASVEQSINFINNLKLFGKGCSWGGFESLALIDVYKRQEHIKADFIEKNEIALCEIELAEKIVLDEFKKHKTLGEMILIDRVSHMTSACGVLETVKSDGEKPYFQKDDIKVGGYVFEEFYFNLENAMMSKACLLYTSRCV